MTDLQTAASFSLALIAYGALIGFVYGRGLKRCALVGML
jgi:hypothetical protein